MLLSLAYFHPTVLAKHPELQTGFERIRHRHGLMAYDKSGIQDREKNLRVAIFLMMGGRHFDMNRFN